jgi:hypothetical protein
MSEQTFDPSGPDPEPLDEFEPLPFEDSEVQDVEGADGEA